MQGTKRIIVIGAGITGLTAAYCLVKKGYDVTIVEASPGTGGLAASILSQGRPVEKYYHFICREDEELVDFAGELGIDRMVHWRQAGTSFFIDGRIYPFDTPFDLLGFGPVPFLQRLRFGLHVFSAQRRKDWRDLDTIPAKRWLIENVGREAYMAIWDPLLRIKFGAFHEQISAAWIWHRIHRVARSRKSMFGYNSYGYFEHGCATLIDALLDRLHGSANFHLVTGEPVKSIRTGDSGVEGVQLASNDEVIPSDVVISTISISSFLKLVPSLGEYSMRLSGIEYLNIVCMLLLLDRPLTESFWLNVNDPAIAFNGIVELTNLNPRPDLGGSHLAYIPFYVHKDDPRWGFTDEEIYREYRTAIKVIRPDFDETWVKNWWISRDLDAQAHLPDRLSRYHAHARNPSAGALYYRFLAILPRRSHLERFSIARQAGRASGKFTIELTWGPAAVLTHDSGVYS